MEERFILGNHFAIWAWRHGHRKEVWWMTILETFTIGKVISRSWMSTWFSIFQEPNKNSAWQLEKPQMC